MADEDAPCALRESAYHPLRFPADFMFQLTAEEFAALRHQSGTSSSPVDAGTARSRSPSRVSPGIMRAFVRPRQLLDSHTALARKLEELERRHDAQFKVVFDAIPELMAPPAEPPRRVGFQNEGP